MKCQHTNTKMKLVSWAIDFKGKHRQGFKMKTCCADCGAVIPARDLAKIKGIAVQALEEDALKEDYRFNFYKAFTTD